MKTLDNARATALADTCVFMSASVPTREEFRRVPDAAFVIEQAVVALVRTVLAGGGRLVFGGHPSISPLVAAVAGEYVLPAPGKNDEPFTPRENRITIYQSRAYEAVLPDETWDMHRLGYARIRWTRRMNGERFDPTKKSPQCPKSLALMRQTMLEETKPRLMVAIGGMDGVIDEARLFRQYGNQRPELHPRLYVLGTTGGAAEQLVAAPTADAPPVHSLEREWTKATGVPLGDDTQFLPYLVMFQWLFGTAGPVASRS